MECVIGFGPAGGRKQKKNGSSEKYRIYARARIRMRRAEYKPRPLFMPARDHRPII